MNKLSIIYQDEEVLVVDKPAGLISSKNNTKKDQTLEDLLEEDFNLTFKDGGLAHRLDKNTSGLLLVARSDESLFNLQNQFKERKIKKEYLALVHGVVENSGRVEGSIGRNPQRHDKFAIMDDGRQALTEYEPIERLQFTGDRLQEIFKDFNKIQMRKLSTNQYNPFTLLRCFPKTGRTHQIRVHLKYIGHPIVSDEKYVGRKMYKLDQRWCPRMFLHAKRLGFYHPVSGKWMEFESELPEDLTNCLKLLQSNLSS